MRVSKNAVWMKTVWMKKNSALLLAALCGALALLGCASGSGSAASGPLPSGTVAENVVKVTARVKAVDLKTREITLERADGSEIRFVAGKEVRNLPQLRVGDEVQASYYESLFFEARRAGSTEPGVDVAAGSMRSKEGEKPGGVEAVVTTLTATITGIDKQAGTVTLRGPQGNTRTIKARYPENLERVAVGDLVDITYTEALAISVETPPAR